MELGVRTKQDAVRKIVTNLAVSGKIKDKDKFISDILERESLGSTGIGHKVAIPHARTETVTNFVIGFGRSPEGIDFNSIDGETVNLIFLMGANPQELNLYLRLLAELSRLLMESSFRRELLSIKDSEEVIEVIKKFEK